MLRDVLVKILRPEWKKLVIPVLALIVISAGIASIYQIRGQALDSKVTSSPKEKMLELSQIQIEEEFLEKNYSEEEKQERLQNFNKSEKYQTDFNKYVRVIEISYSIMPVAPSPRTIGKDKISFFNYKKGYTLFRPVTESKLKTLHYRSEVSKLQRKISENRSNWSEEKIDSRFEEIRSTEINEIPISTLNKSKVPKSGPITDIRNIEEIEWHHFTPALAISFILYYILNSIIIEGLRTLRNQIINRGGE